MTGYKSKRAVARDKLEQAKEILLQYPQKDIDWQREQQIKAHAKLDEEGMYLVHQTDHQGKPMTYWGGVDFDIKTTPPQPAQEHMTELLRRAWDTLDTFKQAYPENWHEEDEQVLKELLRADLKLSGVKLKWVGLTDEDIDVIYEQHHNQYGECESPNFGYERAIEAKLKERNT